MRIRERSLRRGWREGAGGSDTKHRGGGDGDTILYCFVSYRYAPFASHSPSQLTDEHPNRPPILSKRRKLYIDIEMGMCCLTLSRL
jgi:hypothetical protein